MTGDPPEAIKKSAIRTSLSTTDSIAYTSKLISAFVVLTKDGIDSPSSEYSYKIFMGESNTTAITLTPIIQSLAMEGNIW